MGSSDNYSPGYCEYLVGGYASKNIILIRVFAVVLGIILCALLFSLLSVIPQVFAVWLVLIVALEIAVLRLTKCEFEYTIAMGEMKVEAIYGKRWRKKLISFRVAQADRVFQIDGFKDEKIVCLDAERIVYASPKKSEFLYCIYLNDDGGSNTKTAVVFSGCKKLLDAIKFYNRTCIIDKNV